MGEQLDMWSAFEPPKPRAPAEYPGDWSDLPLANNLKAPIGCPEHGPGFVCEECPERYDTDGLGFVHPSACGSRLALRRCAQCCELRTAGSWNHADFLHCLVCVPNGSVSPGRRAAYEALTKASRPSKR